MPRCVHSPPHPLADRTPPPLPQPLFLLHVRPRNLLSLAKVRLDEGGLKKEGEEYQTLLEDELHEAQVPPVLLTEAYISV